jgi:putative two-component system response regulator
MVFQPSPATVLVADDTESVRNLFAELLGADGYRVLTASDGDEALESAQRHRPDILLLDVRMPGVDGIEVCRRVKSTPETRFTPVILVTGLADSADRIEGIEAGADDFLTKPVNSHELRARVRVLARVKQLTDELDSAEAAFMTLALTIEARDPSTNGHCERLARYAVGLGTALGLTGEDLGALHRGGYLHDVGKVGVPDAVLLKRGPLTPAEFAMMRRHPEIGDALCAPLQSLRRVRPIIRHHHERLDGSGYPGRLRGDEVPVLAQIVAIVDVYDALTTDRPYRAALPRAAAVEELEAGVRAGQYNARFVEAFLDATARPHALIDAPRPGAGVAT